MSNISGARSELRRVLGWYVSPVGIVFGGGLALAFGLVVAGASEAAMIVLLVVIATVVPWKFIRQRSEYLEQVGALNEQQRALHAHVDELSAELRSRLDGTLTKRSVRPILQDFRKVDRERINGLQARIVDMEESMEESPDPADEASVSNAPASTPSRELR